MRFFKQILRFMQESDRNGDWLTAKATNKLDVSVVLNTLQEWAKDGMEVTPRIQQYIDYLEGLM